MAKVTKPAKAAAKAASKTASKGASKSASKSKAPAAKARPVGKPAAKARAARAEPTPAEETAAASEAEVTSDLLGAPERALLAKLVLKTGLAPGDVIARALQAFGAANAWASKTASASVKSPPQAPAAAVDTQAPRRLLVSVDGKPAIAIEREPFVLGSGEGCDLRIQLPLIAPRHAQILVREGRHIFEDLQSPRGSFLHGQRIDVRHLEDGDEIDLGGFLPLRFKLA